ncbi:beta-phosphoglucomutase [Bradyrhizobium liaoningense]
MHTETKAIAFDLDGVLVDSVPIHIEAWRGALDMRGIRLPDRQLAQCVGITSPAFAAKLEEWGVVLPDRAQVIETKRQIFRRASATRVIPVRGADRLLRYLAPRLPLALCTMARAQEVDLTLDRCDWRQLFRLVLTCDDVSAPKPDPAIYLTATASLGLMPWQVVALEDSPVGIAAARSAGIRVVGVATTCSAVHLLDAGAECVVDDLDVPELRATLCGKHEPPMPL